MFEYLNDFKQILVTGPQRSGTHICAEMIAYDLGFRCINERLGRFLQGCDMHNIDQVHEILERNVANHLCEKEVVLQCPYASYFCHRLPKSVAVVFMIRTIDEILASQKRIQWRGASLEQLLLQDIGEPCEVKYRNWKWQKPLITHAFEVRYDDLQGHDLWVVASMRKNFLPDQVSINDNNIL